MSDKMTPEEISGFAHGALTALIALTQTLTREQRNQVHASLRKYLPPASNDEFRTGYEKATDRFVRETR